MNAAMIAPPRIMTFSIAYAAMNARVQHGVSVRLFSIAYAAMN